MICNQIKRLKYSVIATAVYITCYFMDNDFKELGLLRMITNVISITP